MEVSRNALPWKSPVTLYLRRNNTAEHRGPLLDRNRMLMCRVIDRVIAEQFSCGSHSHKIQNRNLRCYEVFEPYEKVQLITCHKSKL